MAQTNIQNGSIRIMTIDSINCNLAVVRNHRVGGFWSKSHDGSGFFHMRMKVWGVYSSYMRLAVVSSHMSAGDNNILK
jgi:hypothetical protein